MMSRTGVKIVAIVMAVLLALSGVASIVLSLAA